MSPVVRVHGGASEPPALAAPELARSLPLSLAELLAAARLAGDVPLPFGYDDSGGRLASRLAAGDPDLSRLQASVAEALPGGAAEASLADRGLLAEGRLVAEPTAALHTLAGGRSRVVVDLAVRHRDGTRTLHCWLGVEGRLVARLATADGLTHELAWHDLGRWTAELARIASVDPSLDPSVDPTVDTAVGAAERAPQPAYVSLPSALLVAAARAAAEGRPDLVAELVAGRPGAVRAGEPGRVRPVDAPHARALLHAVASPTARLRALATSGDPARRAVRVLSWLRLGPAWHELVPGPEATTRLRRRAPADLGPALASFVMGFRA